MSAVILQLAEPLLERHGDTPEQAESIIRLTIAGWNKSMFPPDKQPLIVKDLIDAFVPKDGMAADMGTATDLLDVPVGCHCRATEETVPRCPQDRRGLQVGNRGWSLESQRDLRTNS